VAKLIFLPSLKVPARIERGWQSTEAVSIKHRFISVIDVQAKLLFEALDSYPQRFTEQII
jgi:hypothetical protein